MSLNEIPPSSDAFSDRVREELAKSKDETSFISKYKEELSAVSGHYTDCGNSGLFDGLCGLVVCVGAEL